MMEENNKIPKEELDRQLQRISVALTHFAFRCGPIENMHSDKSKNITQKDMKMLNKYMVDHLAAFFYLLNIEDYENVEKILDGYSLDGKEWDKADYDEIVECVRQLRIFPRRG